MLILNAGSALDPTREGGRRMIQSTATQMSKVLSDTCYERLLTEQELLSLEKGEDRPNSLPITSLFLAPAIPILGVWGFGA